MPSEKWHSHTKIVKVIRSGRSIEIYFRPFLLRNLLNLNLQWPDGQIDPLISRMIDPKCVEAGIKVEVCKGELEKLKLEKNISKWYAKFFNGIGTSFGFLTLSCTTRNSQFSIFSFLIDHANYITETFSVSCGTKISF